MKKLIKYKPFSNSVRHKIKINKNLLIKNNNLIKNLKYFYHRKSGRCAVQGKITVRHKGSGSKAIFSKTINTYQKVQGITIGVSHSSSSYNFTSFKFDLNRKKFFYDVSLSNEYPGTLTEYRTSSKDLKLGYRTELKNIPTGTSICLIGNSTEGNAKFVKSAGNTGQIINKTTNSCIVKLPSGKIKSFTNSYFGTIGSISNDQHFLQVLGTAGSNRHLNKRPSVRGIAMNPVDHPHGGRTNGGKPSVTPWGLPTKGKFKLKKRL